MRLIIELQQHAPHSTQRVNSTVEIPLDDLQRVPEKVLAAAKEKMNENFELNVVKVGHPEYQYDKRVEFEQSAEPSDWDD